MKTTPNLIGYKFNGFSFFKPAADLFCIKTLHIDCTDPSNHDNTHFSVLALCCLTMLKSLIEFLKHVL